MSLSHGLLLWHKKAGITSFGALFPIKKHLGKGIKVGHAGTLDKAAHGLELVLIGSFTRLNPIFSHLDKEYIATITFGYETSTLDLEGDTIKHADLPTINQVERALQQQQLGTIMQAPPIYSALHINGKRAYQYAMSGESVEMKLRPVSLHAIEVIAMKTDGADKVTEIILKISCGGGFYVRSFARDFAYSVQSVATLTDLERTAIGNYNHNQKWAFNLSDATNNPLEITQKLLSATDAFKNIKNIHTVHAKQEYYDDIKQGKPFQNHFVVDPLSDSGHPYFVLDDRGNLLAQIYYDTRHWRYQFVVHHPC